MPGKNKPKRLDRNRSWRVARRKREKKARAEGSGRNRKLRPKNKKVVKIGKAVVKKAVKKRAVVKKSKE